MQERRRPCRKIRKQKKADIPTALDKRERDILLLRYYSGKTLREIAARMDISYAYVKILQNKALDSLKKILEKE